MANTIKVDIISGFLGAGKTTLINKLLKECLQDEKVVLVENEFGEIGVDGSFLKDTGVQIKEMTSGCICCSLAGNFTVALREVAAQFSPDRIIIEPSGVGMLSDVVKAVQSAAAGTAMQPDLLITVVDATKIERYRKYIAEFYNDQVGNAAAVILSRTQNLTEEERLKAVSALRELNPSAAMITTPWEELTGSQILSAAGQNDALKEQLLEEIRKLPPREEEDEDEDEDEHEHEHEGHHHHHHHHDADETFDSWGKETPRFYTEEEVEEILSAFDRDDRYGVILRSKGVLPAADGSWIYFDYVPEEHRIRPGEADYTGRICVIGEKLQEEKLEELFSLTE